MIFNDHDLRQIDQAYIESLDTETAMKLALKLLEDLKEARERLNQNPNNSSRPPSSTEPWVIADSEDEEGSDAAGKDSSSGSKRSEKNQKKKSAEPGKPGK